MISQPSLSQYVQKMEENLGVLLFDRSVSPMRLTTEGEYFLKIARTVLEEEQKMMDYFGDLREYKTGTIKIAVSPYASSFLIPKILKEFYARYPLIELKLLDYSSTQLVQGAQSGDFDFALTVAPTCNDVFDVETIEKEEYVIVVPREFAVNRSIEACLSGGTPPVGGYPEADLKWFENTPFVTWNPHSLINEHFEKLCAAAKIHPKRIVECYSSHPMFQIVLAGIGAAIVPWGIIENMMEYNVEKQVCIYRLLQNEYKFERVVVYKKGKYLTKPMKYLIQLMKNQCRSYNRDIALKGGSGDPGGEP